MIKNILFAMLVFVPYASAAPMCPDYEHEKIEIEVIKGYGDLIFDDTRSRSEFEDLAGGAYHHHQDTTGLTIANFNMSVEAFGMEISYPKQDYSCVYLNKIKLYLNYDNIIVLIDKKYPKNSCQYNVILAHEKKHVAVHKQSLDYYAPYITGAMEKAALKIGPRYMEQGENVENILGLLSEELMYEVSDMLNFFEEERDKANARLDTEENYEKERSLCPTW